MSDRWSDRESDSYKSIKGALNYFKKSKLEEENQQLKQQLEVENKNNYEMSAEMEHLRNQLKEAVEVIEFYLSKDLSDCIFKSDEDRHRRFLAKYRGEK